MVAILVSLGNGSLSPVTNCIVQAMLTGSRGWIIPSIIFFPQALAIAELSSSMPVNGACYWWTAALAPSRLSRPLAFVSGWTNVLALFTSVASFSYATSASLRAAIALLEPNWAATDAQLMGMSFAMIFLWTCLTVLKLENIAMVYIGCGKFQILIETNDYSQI